VEVLQPMSKIGKMLFAIAILAFMAMLVIYPAEFLEAGREAIRLCLDVIIPSLFPFLVAVGILTRIGLPRYMSRNLSPLMRPIFNIPGSGALALVMGLISGYPLGAKITRELYESGDCTKTEAERMLAFCNNSGPLFIVGAVGAGMLFSPAIGQILYVSHVLSAIAVGILFKFYRKDCEHLMLPTTALVVRKEQNPGIVSSIGDAVYSAAQTMAKICGFVILFAAVVSALPNLGNQVANAGAAGIFEITEGVLLFAQIYGIPLPLKFAAISFILAFSGISVMAQVAAIIKGSGLSMIPYVVGKFLAGIFSAGITFVIFILTPLTLEPISPVGGNALGVPNYGVAPTEPLQLFLGSLTAIALALAGIVAAVAIVRTWRKFKA